MEEEDYCIKCKQGILNNNKCLFCSEVYCEKCETEKCNICQISFKDEKCPICLDRIDIEKDRYFTCHNCATVGCSTCCNNLKKCPCCRDKLESPKLYFIKKFKKVLKIKPDIINNIIGCIWCKIGNYKLASKYFKKSKLKMAKDNLDLINGVNINYKRFNTEGFWYTSLYSLNDEFYFILNKVDFSNHLAILARLYFEIEKYDNFYNIVFSIDFNTNNDLLNLLGCYYYSRAKKINKPKGIRFFIKAIEKGNYLNLKLVANCYLEGLHDIKQDVDKGIEYLLLGIEKGKKESYLSLAKYHYNKNDKSKAIFYIKEALVKGIELENEFKTFFLNI